MRALLLLAALVFLGAVDAHAQPADDCSGPACLDGSDTLSFNGATTPGNAAFNLTGTGCTASGVFTLDGVVCFEPTSSCSVNFSCTSNGTGNIWVNVRNMGAGSCPTACVHTAGPCVNSAGPATPPTATLTNVSLIGGINYCFICSTADQAPAAQQTFAITLAAGSADCGALPVELMSFDVGG
jgi:hypothetical protein